MSKMARVKTKTAGDKVTQTCAGCGSSNVECWSWQENPIIDYMNNGRKVNIGNKLVQRWACWGCEVNIDMVELQGSREWMLCEY